MPNLEDQITTLADEVVTAETQRDLQLIEKKLEILGRFSDE